MALAAVAATAAEPGVKAAGDGRFATLAPKGLAAAAVTWRAASDGPAFSLDGGVVWHALSAACLSPRPNPSVARWTLAVDAGDPRHVVAAIAGPTASGDTAGCGDYKPCQARQIAWTDDAAPQMNAVLRQARAPVPAGAVEVDKQSTWKFSSLSHLAAPKDDASIGLCAMTHDALPNANCTTDQAMVCHWRREPSAVATDWPAFTPMPRNAPTEDGCLRDPAKAFGPCNCTLQDACTYPVVAHLAVDPRNGMVYASTNVGLLLSQDGGRSWSRTGDEAPPLLQPNPRAPYPRGLGARLITREPSGCRTAQAQEGCDLQKVPQRIRAVGALTMVFAPEPNAFAWFSPRPLGCLTATVTVEWDADDARLPGQTVRRTSVFAADSPTFGSFGALTFYDTAWQSGGPR